MRAGLEGERPRIDDRVQVENRVPWNSLHGPFAAPCPPTPQEGDLMAWQKPQATDLRYGFEITMYISNR